MIVLRVIFFILILFVYPGYGGEIDRIEFNDPKDIGYEISIVGFINKPGTVNPGDIMAEFFVKNKQFHDLYSFNSYKFLGRTGERSFEVEMRERYVAGNLATVTKVNMYLDKPGSLIPLQYNNISNHTRCNYEADKVYLKVIGLQGSKLKYQIMLPKCLSK